MANKIPHFLLKKERKVALVYSCKHEKEAA